MKADIFVLEKRLSTLRHEDLLGRLAIGTLEAKNAPDDRVAIVLIRLPKLSARASDRARDFMNEYAHGTQWAIVSDRNELAISAPLIGYDWQTHFPARRQYHVIESKGANLFTDLNQLMLMLLLTKDNVKSWWVGKVPPRWTKATLAEKAGVSTAHTARFVRAFQAADYLRNSPDEGLVIVRRSELLTEWLNWAKRPHRASVPMRFLFGAPNNGEDLFEMLWHAKARQDPIGEGPQYVVTGFTACRAHGLLHTFEGTTEIYFDTKNLETICSTYRAEICDKRNAHFFALPTRHKTMFRGVDPGKRKFTNLIQTALDVVKHPARGWEQAEHIIEHYLEWGRI